MLPFLFESSACDNGLEGMKLKDPCIDASCASMSDENFINGDSSANSYNSRKEYKRSNDHEPVFKVGNHENPLNPSSCERFGGKIVLISVRVIYFALIVFQVSRFFVIILTIITFAIILKPLLFSYYFIVDRI